MPTPEIVDCEWEGCPVRAILSHADAVAFLDSEGLAAPAIPTGCNTVTAYFATRAGGQALAVNQCSFARELGDNEREVNGCTVVWCLVPGDLIDQRALLKRFLLKMIG